MSTLQLNRIDVVHAADKEGWWSVVAHYSNGTYSSQRTFTAPNYLAAGKLISTQLTETITVEVTP